MPLSSSIVIGPAIPSRNRTVFQKDEKTSIGDARGGGCPVTKRERQSSKRTRKNDEKNKPSVTKISCYQMMSFDRLWYWSREIHQFVIFNKKTLNLLLIGVVDNVLFWLIFDILIDVPHESWRHTVDESDRSWKSLTFSLSLFLSVVCIKRENRPTHRHTDRSTDKEKWMEQEKRSDGSCSFCRIALHH